MGGYVVADPTDNMGISSVKVVTWTTADQSDKVERTAKFNGVATYYVDIPKSAYRTNPEVYISHIYVYDVGGNCTQKEVQYWPDYEGPTISKVYLSEISSSKFRVVGEISDSDGISKVQIATWTTADQSDLKWRDAWYNGAGSYFIDIPMNEHNSNPDVFISHIYAYDTFGNLTTKEILFWYKATVKFNANGGTCSTTSKSVTYGGTYGTLPTSTRNGYTFAGWYTSASGGTKITADTKAILTANQTLYAHWTAKSYTVTYNSNGGNAVSPTSKSVTYGGTYGTLPTPTRNGYSFAGWYTSASGGTKITADTKAKLTANQTLYAHWTAKTYTVTYNSNGGNAVSPTSKSVTYNGTYGTLPTPARTGYSFTGWYTAKTGGTKITADTKVTIIAAQTLYAQWKANSYTVTYNANGGDAVSPTSKSVTYGSTYGTLPTPTRNGYTFAGWYTTASGGTKITADSKVTITANQTLYAHWTTKSYTVTYNSNGGDAVNPSSKSVTYGGTFGTLPTPVRTGYSFTGWYTAKTGGTKITAESKVTITDNQILYAHWDISHVLLTFDANGGTAEFDTLTVVNGKTYTMLPEAEHVGYDFMGWYLDELLTKPIAEGDIVSLSENQNVYAKWKANGDVNGDSLFNVADVVKLQKHIISKEKISEEVLSEADINNDGIVNIFDMIVMRRKLIEV